MRFKDYRKLWKNTFTISEWCGKLFVRYRIMWKKGREGAKRFIVNTFENRIVKHFEVREIWLISEFNQISLWSLKNSLSCIVQQNMLRFYKTTPSILVADSFVDIDVCMEEDLVISSKVSSFSFWFIILMWIKNFTVSFYPFLLF